MKYTEYCAAAVCLLLSGCASAPQEIPSAGFSAEDISIQRAAERRMYSGKIIFLLDSALPETAKKAERLSISAKEQKLRIEFREVDRKQIPGLIRAGYADGGIGNFSAEDALDFHLAQPEKGILIRLNDSDTGRLFQAKSQTLQIQK